MHTVGAHKFGQNVLAEEGLQINEFGALRYALLLGLPASSQCSHQVDGHVLLRPVLRPVSLTYLRMLK